MRSSAIAAAVIVSIVSALWAAPFQAGASRTPAVCHQRDGYQRLRHRSRTRVLAQDRHPEQRRLQRHRAPAPQLGRLYVTSHRGDELICLDLATDAVLWRRNVGAYADSHWVTPDGRRIYMPLRGEIAWAVLDAADGSELARIDTERGKRYEVDPIQDIGPHNTWINQAGTRVYMEVLTVPYIYVADAKTNKSLERSARSARASGHLR